MRDVKVFVGGVEVPKTDWSIRDASLHINTPLTGVLSVRYTYDEVEQSKVTTLAIIDRVILEMMDEAQDG